MRHRDNNSELLVLVTPEIVRPIPAGQPLPELNLPHPFMTKNSDIATQTPGYGQDRTGAGEAGDGDHAGGAVDAAA